MTTVPITVRPAARHLPPELLAHPTFIAWEAMGFTPTSVSAHYFYNQGSRPDFNLVRQQYNDGKRTYTVYLHIWDFFKIPNYPRDMPRYGFDVATHFMEDTSTVLTATTNQDVEEPVVVLNRLESIWELLGKPQYERQ